MPQCLERNIDVQDVGPVVKPAGPVVKPAGDFVQQLFLAHTIQQLDGSCDMQPFVRGAAGKQQLANPVEAQEYPRTYEQHSI